MLLAQAVIEQPENPQFPVDLAKLLEIERISPGYANGRVQKGMSAIFAILGESSELMAKYRRLLIEQS